MVYETANINRMWDVQIPVLVSMTSVLKSPLSFTELHQILHVADNYGPFHVWE